MLIQKFGGTSVGSAERMKHVAALIIRDDLPKIVVLSAMSGTTNQLVEIAAFYTSKKNEAALQSIDKLHDQYKTVVHQLYYFDEYKQKSLHLLESHFEYLRSFAYDIFTANEVKCVLAQGELISTSLFQFYLEECGIESKLIPALNFMRIDRDGEPDTFYIRQNLERELSSLPGTSIFITQGFICRDVFGEIDNLKRGGSDYSASLIGAAVDASEVQIWTDIDGFHDNDPRIVKDTHPIAALSFDEAAELAYFGAKILHPATIQPAKTASIPVRVKNTLDPDAFGTLISDISIGAAVKAVAAKDGITAIRIKSGRMLLAYGFLSKIFELFEIYRTPIDMIATSEISVSLTIDDTTNLHRLIADIGKYGTVEIDKDQVIICIVGEGIAGNTNAMRLALEALKEIPVRMISYGGSQNNISILVSSSDKKQALNCLSAKLFSHKDQLS
ncbi:MAG: aspartate kinase [Bacteroidales bacterium]|nr:aspartate kinase [Bacteroidales bacterium]